jgi:enolase
MPAFHVADLSALEILDSRGRPTLAVTVRLADGTPVGDTRMATGER